MDEDQTGSKHQNNRNVCGKTLTWEEQLSVMRTMFPFVSSKEALQDKHFVKGYACSCRIFAMENREEWTSVKHILTTAITEYQRSYEEDGKTFRYYNSFCCPHCGAPYIDYKKNPGMKQFGVSGCVHLGRKAYHAGSKTSA